MVQTLVLNWNIGGKALIDYSKMSGLIRSLILKNATQLKMTSTIATQPSGISQQQKGTTKKTTENNTQGSNHNESIGTGRKR